MTDKLILKPGRDKSLKRRHPWVFSGAVGSVEGEPGLGDTVDVFSAQGERLGCAAYSPQSSIRARMWAFGEEDCSDMASFLTDKMRIAIYKRVHNNLFNTHNNGLRLIHAESDGLPGLVVDQYDNWLTAQFLTAGAEKWKPLIVDALAEITGLGNIYERSDADVRALEGLQEITGLLKGETPPGEVIVTENDLKYGVDIQKGHKTGFYLDQRDNRQVVAAYARDKRVLNCFSYTGGFAVSCLANGASQVVSIDSSADVLELGKRNLELNELPVDKAEWLCADVFHELRAMRDRRESFDLIILDPPKFAPTVGQVRAAARGYKDINLLAFKLLNPGGILATFSCSGGVDRALFQKIVADAALDAGVEAQIVRQLSQAPDHPIALNFPEGEYLKGLICQIN
ncbi:class I SAM-dependent rRNA methyltransferase [Pelolinea submarina]|uniref:23S rRNA (Cytosine1962-C5)-methyltransferase n=1 Tax=Pelolinea submarina TaxID=913107 RepID=A0A347ZT19_9CHLR|nr:class I SAM-dependent methyltransferase [Pelolinea submarina]REG10974.1 23S rRNA (cytosine1962-C5)-methyltransferase [Pelolinea submarina]BBB48450.1 23S rRNA (cytosine1962-C5)-methyltransferase [Pelolinea submarina]